MNPPLPTSMFRRQHAELQKMARSLTAAALTPGSDAGEIQRLLRRFVGKLRVHAIRWRT